MRRRGASAGSATRPSWISRGPSRRRWPDHRPRWLSSTRLRSAPWGDSWRRTARRSGTSRCGLKPDGPARAPRRGGRQPLGGHRPVRQRPFQADALARRGRRGRSRPCWSRRADVSVGGPRRASAGSPATAVFEYPYSATLVIGLLVVASPYSPIPAHRARPVRAARARRRNPADAAVGRSAAGPRALHALGPVRRRQPPGGARRAWCRSSRSSWRCEMLAGIAVITYSLRRRGTPAPSTGEPDDGPAGRLPGRPLASSC